MNTQLLKFAFVFLLPVSTNSLAADSSELNTDSTPPGLSAIELADPFSLQTSPLRRPLGSADAPMVQPAWSKANGTSAKSCLTFSYQRHLRFYQQSQRAISATRQQADLPEL